MQALRVAFAILAASAVARSHAIEPLSNDVSKLLQTSCAKNNIVRKRWLAAAILDLVRVRSLLAEQLDDQQEPQVLSPAEYLLTKNPDICKPGENICSRGDRDSVGAALSEADYIVNEVSSSDGTKFAKVGDFKTGPDYFRNAGAQISCKYGLKKAADNTPSPRLLRVRSKSEDLYISNDEKAYQALKPATLSYDQDNVAHKRTRSAIGVVGYAFRLPKNPIGLREIVPYFGIDSELSKSAGSKASTKADTRTFGIMTDAAWTSSIVNYLALNPALLSDLQHHSKLFTATVYYQPVLDNYLNSNHEIAELGASPLFFQFVLNGQIHHGHYTDGGNLAPAESADYDRFGGTIGFSFLTNSKDYPFAWTTTKSWYRGSGLFKTIGKFNSTLTFGFGPGGTFSWSISYDRGRDVDTTVLEREWKLSLGIKY